MTSPSSFLPMTVSQTDRPSIPSQTPSPFFPRTPSNSPSSSVSISFDPSRDQIVIHLTAFPTVQKSSDVPTSFSALDPSSGEGLILGGLASKLETISSATELGDFPSFSNVEMVESGQKSDVKRSKSLSATGWD